MTTLTGTEKQINWANEIRAKKIAHLEALIEKTANLPEWTYHGLTVEQRTKREAQNAALLERYNTALRFLATKTEARWWIKERDTNLATLDLDSLARL